MPSAAEDVIDCMDGYSSLVRFHWCAFNISADDHRANVVFLIVLEAWLSKLDGPLLTS